jgi:NADH:ubiquinone oxidoreductase subunit 6 (subunit J)
MLIIYHAVFSITIPIVLVELAYPERKGDSWIGKRTLAGLAALLTFVTALGYFLLAPYIPPLTHYSLAIIAMFLFVYTAYKIPLGKQKGKEKKANKPKLFWVAGLVSTIIFFLLFWA